MEATKRSNGQLELSLEFEFGNEKYLKIEKTSGDKISI
jgi:hypothetical protein